MKLQRFLHFPFLLGILLFGISFTQAGRAQRFLRFEGVDYFGHDLSILKNVDLDRCQSACREEPACQAFTYNRKARWCFLKSDYEAPRRFSGAVSGHVVEPASSEQQRAQRLAALDFLSQQHRKSAAQLREQIAAQALPKLPPMVLHRRAATAETRQLERAITNYRQALRLNPEDAELWLSLSRSYRAIRDQPWRVRREIPRHAQLATAAAINGYLVAGTKEQRQDALVQLGQSLANRSQWLPAIRAYRAALALGEDAALRKTYTQWMRRHGFRILRDRVDADAREPRICIAFSHPLPKEREDLADYVRVDPSRGLAITVEAEQICVEGVRHGERYGIHIRPGLPAANGEILRKGADLKVYVRDRSPSVYFPDQGYVVPRGEVARIPLTSVNASRVQLQLYRIDRRALIEPIREGDFLHKLNAHALRQLKNQSGELLWSGEIETKTVLNQAVTTAVPISELIQTPEPGLYLLTARLPGEDEEDSTRPQWFIVSDLGLASYQGNDGLHVLVRSLSDAQPKPAIQLRLIARNHRILGETTTDASGYGRFDPGLLRGTGGNRPLLLEAFESTTGDYAFLSLKKAPFDLSDRGANGRPAPKPIDLFFTTERGIYQPGETVYFTVLARDQRAYAQPDLPLTLIVRRPNGVEHSRHLLQEEGLGGYSFRLPLSSEAMHGSWKAAIYTDPEDPPLAERRFLVADFQPERLDFQLQPEQTVLRPEKSTKLSLRARFLFGAPAAGLTVEGDLRLEPVDRLPDYPGYRFGLAEEEVKPIHLPLPEATTDAAGLAQLPIRLPALPPVSKPFSGTLIVRLLEAGGRPVERQKTLPVQERKSRIGIRPQFEDSVEEGGNAAFLVRYVGGDTSATQAPRRLRWTLSKLHTRFQWYHREGDWNYEPVTTRRQVASGHLEVQGDQPIPLEVPVDWGRYELQVMEESGAAVPASLRFHAGWYSVSGKLDTPDFLRVSLDRPKYRVGETARVHIESRFPGIALVMVVDDRLIAMKTIEISSEEGVVDLLVTEDWGPGAYILVNLYRPMNQGAKQMPARAIGLRWATVDPEERKLSVRFTVPPEVKPRGPLEIGLKVEPLSPGEEAYVVLAAVDLGILNLTNYRAPDPDGWYFGQRQLGMEIRDFYGQLINPMQGALGIVRSGGGAGMRVKGIPPTEKHLAFYSGIHRVDAQGEVKIRWALPDFNGTIRLMAMAWSAQGVGHGVQDVIARDPIVMQVSLPPFLAPGDRTQMLVELRHVQGPAGTITLSLDAQDAGIAIAPTFRHWERMLHPKEQMRLRIPLQANQTGDHSLVFRLTTPDGQRLTKTVLVPVRMNRPEIRYTRRIPLEPQGKPWVWDPAPLREMVPGTGRVLLSATGAGRLDVAGLLQALDRYPYGCTEQITSRALPLLYLNEVALSAGLPGDSRAAPRIRQAIADLLNKQDARGGFSLWGNSGESFWLSAYVTDFLSRAKEAGYAVPEPAFSRALDSLSNQLSYTNLEEDGEGFAYGLYVLARNGRAVLGDLRYYGSARLQDFPTPLAQAQLGAALALYGENRRAAQAFQTALASLQRGEAGEDWRGDYGSRLRDGAALLTLAAETAVGTLDLRALGAALNRWFVEMQGDTNTQENAWLLLAAHALMQSGEKPALALNGQRREGPLMLRLESSELKEPLRIQNLGPRPIDLLVTISGVPQIAPTAGGQGYRIERAYYDLQGRRVSLDQVHQGQRLIAVLSVRADRQRAARLILDDPLPAGFEIENPHLLRSGELKQLPWLSDDLESSPDHQEFRSDRFLAALERSARQRPFFQLAYRLRAVSPGDFLHPAATLSDMYRPQWRAWTAETRVQILEHP